MDQEPTTEALPDVAGEADRRGQWRRRIMWAKVRRTCPVCKKDCVRRYATLRHMRWAHSLVAPGAEPLRSKAEYAAQLKRMRAGKVLARNRRKSSPPSLPLTPGAEVRWYKSSIEVPPPSRSAVPNEAAAVHFCPNCGFELERVNIRR